ncbi:hypothetical protein [Streptomyces sp. TS71-3]|uniref:hypothetical protein n=1 Tax=Streptomyces sp. TS71-3 TaxID=2733862 RepID=UPI001BB35A26|nr:hypothetical protein [Streptomyces sp. TS71-3]
MDGIDADLYVGITDFAQDTPNWLKILAEFWTEAGMLLFCALPAAGWWRARRAGARTMALALLAPVAAALVYTTTDLLASLLRSAAIARRTGGAVACGTRSPARGCAPRWRVPAAGTRLWPPAASKAGPGAVRHGVARCGVARCGVARCGVARCAAVRSRR